VSAPDGYDTRVPSNVYEYFQSGAARMGTTVSSLFDIEFRNYKIERDRVSNFIQNGSDYLTGGYRQITNVILNDRYEVGEGLVIDTKKGGVGFRNHTIPTEQFTYGASWEEDLLFIEPVTECVNLNISVDFTYYPVSAMTARNMRLVDHGGFHALSKEYPWYNVSDHQKDPMLRYRAYKGGWYSNVLTMLLFNITNPSDRNGTTKAFQYWNSHEGKEFPLPVEYNSKDFLKNATSLLQMDSIVTGHYSEFLGFSGFWNEGTNATQEVNGTITNDTFLSGYDFLPPNPFNLSLFENYTEARK
jgi:hypothetical protein